MTGETDLKTLLASMEPTLDPAPYVFVTTQAAFDYDALTPLMVFQEAEGTTLILRKEVAEVHGLDAIFSCKRITLNVHSSLEAVGFIACIATKLADHGMGVNPVAGFYHDHLFIAEHRVDDAMAVLTSLSGR